MSFSQLLAAKKNTENGATVTSLRSSFFHDNFKVASLLLLRKDISNCRTRPIIFLLSTIEIRRAENLSEMPTKNDVFFSAASCKKRHHFWWASQTKFQPFLFRQGFNKTFFYSVSAVTKYQNKYFVKILNQQIQNAKFVKLSINHLDL